MSGYGYQCLYLAVGDDCVKIGISVNPKRRLRRSGMKIVRTWEHENPYFIEQMCVQEWFYRTTLGREHFDATPKAAERLVARMMRRYDDGGGPLAASIRGSLMQSKSRRQWAENKRKRFQHLRKLLVKSKKPRSR